MSPIRKNFSKGTLLHKALLDWLFPFCSSYFLPGLPHSALCPRKLTYMGHLTAFVLHLPVEFNQTEPQQKDEGIEEGEMRVFTLCAPFCVGVTLSLQLHSFFCLPPFAPSGLRVCISFLELPLKNTMNQVA